MNVETATCLPDYVVFGTEAPDPRAAAIEAWTGTLGPDDALEQRYDALCEGSPCGAPVLRLVHHVASGRCVGVAALAPRRMVLRGREVRGAVLAHFAIHRGHRSLGPAVMLLESLLAAAAGRVDVVYGIPRNSEGAGAALRRAGLRPIGEMQRLVRVVRHGRYLARKIPAPLARTAGWVVDRVHALRDLTAAWRAPPLRRQWIDACDARMDRIWARGDAGEALTSERGADILRWRFDHAPGAGVRYLVLEDDRGGALCWFACEVDPRWPHILNVVDFWSLGGCDGPSAHQVRALVRQAWCDGMATVSLSLCATAAGRAPWRSAGFVERGRQVVYGSWFDSDLAAQPPALHFTDFEQDG
ncbi:MULTISPECIES: hypothetical protein [unclassified Luteimonas]|uniref:hypothetical protein n=1 Tax=unclassified Luteimonas TaxID=2629088 RepID=UPI0015FFD0A9|nr:MULTISPECIES: hypothetical protein [unclassified Luteimonas]MBB1472350.1 hypothetical protein [Luteimonas sp. MC1782]MBB6598933.1 hypothetical protein [Luteimonas sp. MC1825]QOC89076.1 hypothetical protein IDM46_04935 [Luteimonas sp. MC1825]